MVSDPQFPGSWVALQGHHSSAAGFPRVSRERQKEQVPVSHSLISGATTCHFCRFPLVLKSRWVQLPWKRRVRVPRGAISRRKFRSFRIHIWKLEKIKHKTSYMTEYPTSVEDARRSDAIHCGDVPASPLMVLHLSVFWSSNVSFCFIC